MRFSLGIVSLSVVLAGWSQQAPARPERHDGTLRLEPSTANRLPERPPRKQPAAERPQPKVSGDGMLTLAELDLGAALELKGTVVPFAGNADGVLFGGYDPVVRFADGKAVQGKLQFEAGFAGKTVRFVSEENRLKFVKEPEAYLSEFGGYCAYHLSKGEAVTADSRSFRIVSGRMYEFSSEAIARSWERSPEVLLVRAREAWAQLARR